jgi:hypothetical protein
MILKKINPMVGIGNNWIRCSCSNGVGLDAFTHAIKNGILVRKDPDLERLRFRVKSQGNLKFLRIASFYGIRTKEL